MKFDESHIFFIFPAKTKCFLDQENEENSKRIFYDIIYETNRNFQENSLNFTVPTSVTTDKMHAAKMRLDYILMKIPGNFQDLQKVVKSSGVIRNSITNRLSDHFPIFVEIENSFFE